VEKKIYNLENKRSTKIEIHIDPQIISDFSHFDFSKYQQVSQLNAKTSLLKKDQKIMLLLPDGESLVFPYYLNNIISLLELQSIPDKYSGSHPFDNFLKTTQNIKKRIFSNASLNPGESFKDLWDEIIKKINQISNESHSLTSLMENLLNVPFLQKFESSLLVLHLKGQTKAKLFGIIWRSEKKQSLIEVKDFNVFFNSIKKSKIKSFTTESFHQINLHFNGSFLAKEVISKKYSLIATVSRNDFLSYSKNEIELFETCIDLLQPHFERLIEQEFSDKTISELRTCLKDFPIPIRVKDSLSGSIFLNDLFSSALQDSDIFFHKKIRSQFSVDLFDCDDLRHYAFDLFHFQRISLLGELLNTLRHELSNPLFGLNLGSELFDQMEISQDNKTLMNEVRKNIIRSQKIIQKFSNLYQVQEESKLISVKNMVDESIVLTKSESKDVKKTIVFLNNTDELEIDVPGIFVIQILFNLIVNASQAMKNQILKRELHITINRSVSELFIDLVDSGPNIPEAYATQIFKPFFTTKTQGTGLGLVLSKNLALKMGGNLEYLINNNSRGAHFRLTLPIS
jgi:two-component system NtrC family sensor kinase